MPSGSCREVGDIPPLEPQFCGCQRKFTSGPRRSLNLSNSSLQDCLAIVRPFTETRHTRWIFFGARFFFFVHGHGAFCCLCVRCVNLFCSPTIRRLLDHFRLKSLGLCRQPEGPVGRQGPQSQERWEELPLGRIVVDRAKLEEKHRSRPAVVVRELGSRAQEPGSMQVSRREFRRHMALSRLSGSGAFSDFWPMMTEWMGSMRARQAHLCAERICEVREGSAPSASGHGRKYLARISSFWLKPFCRKVHSGPRQLLTLRGVSGSAVFRSRPSHYDDAERSGPRSGTYQVGRKKMFQQVSVTSFVNFFCRTTRCGPRFPRQR